MAYRLIERIGDDRNPRFAVHVLSELDDFNPETIDLSRDFVLEDYHCNVLEYRVSGFHHRSARR